MPPPERTPFPTFTPHPCTANVPDGLARVVDAKSRFDDATILLLDTFKASSYQADSAAVTTAMAELNRAKQDAQNVPVTPCIRDLSENLAVYTSYMTETLRRCVYDKKDCDRIGEEMDYSADDYIGSLRIAECFTYDSYCSCVDCRDDF